MKACTFLKHLAFSTRPQESHAHFQCGLTRFRNLVMVSVICLLLPVATTAQITFDAAASNSCDSCTVLGWSHTVGNGNNRILVVGLASNTNTENFPPAISVTYNDQPLTRQVLNGGGHPISEIWTLLAS